MMLPQQKKKKVDYEALNSSLMRIPRMNVAAVRSLINIGVREIYELKGRAPEILFEEARLKNQEIPADQIRFFRMAVYFAECETPEASKMNPSLWN